MSRTEDRILEIRTAIERAETQGRELMAAEAELEHASRRINDQLERLGGRDPENERKRRELREVIAVNAKERRRLQDHLRDLRRDLGKFKKSNELSSNTSK